MGDRWATGLLEVTDDLSVLGRAGRWAVALPFDGDPVCARFATWSTSRGREQVGAWQGPPVEAWRSSMGESSYMAAVEAIRESVAAGSVYQANLCRVLSAPMPPGGADDVAALWWVVEEGNPSPHGGFLRLPEHGVAIASASPELFLSVRRPQDGTVVRSGPIKGTGRTAADLSDKDAAENIMIVDLVRNDLSRVSVPGSVVVPELLQVQEHPGLVHLVSYVEGRLVEGTTWPELLEATFPPGSVTGAPKLAALDVIAELETASREYYCGAFGWVDADTGEAELAVAIRTFWLRDDLLHFGTGAGITWGSDAAAEWRETELKAARLIGIAAGTWQGDAP